MPLNKSPHPSDHADPIRFAAQPLLAIRGLRKSFGGVKAINGIDLNVFEREIVGVFGPNGSGKTTTFNAVTGLVRADFGSIQWKGEQELVGAPPWTIFFSALRAHFRTSGFPLVFP